MTAENWRGVPGTSEHRTTGGRAWCFNDSEWCSPASWCQCCDVTRVPDRWKGMYAGEVLAELRAQVEGLLEYHTFAADGSLDGADLVLRSDVLALLADDPTVHAI